MKLIFLIFALHISYCLVTCVQITLITKLGNITGVERNILDNKLLEFRKIPYAKAPVGNLRFEKPVPYGSWTTPLDATTFSPSCYQDLPENVKNVLINKIVTEDCLFLNIQVPFTVTPKTKKSVMVWIHGGGFSTGQAALYDTGRFAITGDVIVVTINYRLNVFGFLSTTDLDGNYGIWDQILAIQWIKNNIESFGGNSDSITIFGESAGGFSVGLLSIASRNDGLFQRAIMQSGVAISPYSMGQKANSSLVSQFVNCTHNDKNLVSCLKRKTSSELFEGLTKSKFRQQTLLGIQLAPVVDGKLFLDHPLKLLNDADSPASKFYRSLDVIIGTISGEASLFVFSLQELQKPFHFNISDGIPKRILTDFLAPEIAKAYFNGNPRVITAIIGQYGQSNDIMRQTFDILDLYTDLLFFVPAVRSLLLHDPNNAKKSRQFLYMFYGQPSFPLFGPLPPWFNRSEHAADTMYQFATVLCLFPLWTPIFQKISLSTGQILQKLEM
ncbi:Putative inactive carboxylesterase 4 [Mytilus coruscus]|uniref:Carboxylic ester hydrolase n=1 Tax=Mytilus coruscus TaxID=42192 RepID=A0A6J8C100_MYTCO|nr:Putative inactive carboxylesterase 4 [Mytilus coruscus]